MLSADPQVVARVRTGLMSLYGERIERIVLFGSRARGDAAVDSDYDVAVFLRDLRSRLWPELGRIAEITQDVLEKTGAVVNVLPVRAGSWRERTPLMHEIRKDGVDL